MDHWLQKFKWDNKLEDSSINIFRKWLFEEDEKKVFLRDLSAGVNKYKDSVWVFFDTETTGLDGNKSQLLEVAAIAVNSDLAEDAAVISQFHTKVNLTPDTEKTRKEPFIPKTPKDKSIDDLLKMTQYHNTTSGAKYIEEKNALIEFADYLKKLSSQGQIVLVAHNANFDKSFIEARNRLYNLPEIQYEIIDTLQIMQEVFYPLLHVVDEMGILPKIKTKFGFSFTLGNVSQALNIDVDDWHSALADVKMLIKVTRAVVRLLEKNGELDVTAGYSAAMKRKASLEKWKAKKALSEGRFSKYWKQRIENRAKRAKREPNNKIDREWAKLQQEKSSTINKKLYKIFEKEIMINDDLSEEIENFLKEIRRKRIKKQKEIQEKKVELTSPKSLPKKKTLPNPYKDAKVTDKYPFSKDRTGGVAKVYKKRSKQSGGPTAAPGEAFGPMEEEKNDT